MSDRRCALVAWFVALLSIGAVTSSHAKAADDGCLSFVGDVVLSRGVAKELHRRNVSPWEALNARGPIVGNLEGAVGEGTCVPGHNVGGVDAPCLSIAEADLAWLKSAPFTAMSLANNHSHDHGSEGFTRTEKALTQLGIAALIEENAPQFLNVGGRTWALVPINLASRPAAEWPAALVRTRMQIGLGRARTPWVVVLPHWGREYDEHPRPEQTQLATLFHAWGALLIIGAHAHVPQDIGCSANGADYFGIGNHLFDQPHPNTWRGLHVRCCPRDGQNSDGLSCTTRETRRSETSTFPILSTATEKTCELTPADPTNTTWLHHPGRDKFVYVQPFTSLGPNTFFALHRRYSDLDRQEALRPYVFRMSGKRPTDFIELWRGTALSRPLLAARLIRSGQREYLCAIHRGDSFLRPDPSTTERKYVVYEWTGFGFRGVRDGEAMEMCQRM